MSEKEGNNNGYPHFLSDPGGGGAPGMMRRTRSTQPVQYSHNASQHANAATNMTTPTDHHQESAHTNSSRYPQNSSVGRTTTVKTAPAARLPHQQLPQYRSALSSTPHYSRLASSRTTSNVESSAATSEAGEGEYARDNNSRNNAPQLRFCGHNLVASINCASSTMDESSHRSHDAIRGGSSSSSKGPLLLELHRLRLHPQRWKHGSNSLPVTAVRSRDDADSDDQHAGGQDSGPASFDNYNDSTHALFVPHVVAISRGNPSLGTSVNSCCLDVMPAIVVDATGNDVPSNDMMMPPPCVTGLSTGALCLHTFRPDDDVVVEYYQMPRHNQRPATAVAWHPGSSRVMLGLASSSGAGSGMTNAGPGLGFNSGGGSGSGANNTKRSVSGGLVGMAGVGGALASSVALRQPGAMSGGGMGAVSGAGGYPPGSSVVSGSSEREATVVLWDVATQSVSMSGPSSRKKNQRTTPIFKLSPAGGVASLAWLAPSSGDNSSLLAVGSHLRNLMLYDVRASSQLSPPVTVYAHSAAVHGVAVDPLRPHNFATFSRSSQEPVKIWDVRKMDAARAEIKIGSDSTNVANTKGSDSGLQTPATAAAVAGAHWSMLDAGFLSIAVGNAVYEYDVSAAGARPTHVNTITAASNLQAFCLFPSPSLHRSSEKRSVEDDLIAELYPNRMLVVHEDRTVHDVAQNVLAPMAISRRDGRLVHALGRTMWMGSTGSGPAAMERLNIRCDEDISATMMRRARCLHVAKYSMDTAANIKMLAGDGIVSAETAHDDSSLRDALLRVWSWIDRVEALCADADDELDDIWPARGLLDAGAYKLLSSDSEEVEEQKFSVTLCCKTYDSPGRRAALTSCGWAGKFELMIVLGECEELGEFERSAALAVFHGDIGAAVDALERGAEFVRTRMTKSRRGKDPRLTTQYAEILELVSLCIAGFRGGDVESASFRIWRKSCNNLMQRGDLTGSTRTSSRVAYVRSLLKFLMSLGVDNDFQEILSYSELSLCDRVAFACRFLSHHELMHFLERCIVDCQNSGNIEGLTVTGIEKEGIVIIRAYVDRYSDVQTAALITSRVILPQDWNDERRASSEWLECYRDLLNTWQMWQSRAMFDVDRADLLRRVKHRQTEMTVSRSNSHNAGRRVPPPSPAKKQPRQGYDPDIQSSVPAQLDARCNYCSSPLGLKQNERHANHLLLKMKPIISCCPQCRKPLPRCAICMLSLGVLNPYLELTKERSRPNRGSGTTTPDDLSGLANLPFAEWFTWCMHCKHGGHAHHLVGWFATHDVCPVSGCNCHCQFDGIQKLQRPALSAHNDSRDGEDVALASSSFHSNS